MKILKERSTANAWLYGIALLSRPHGSVNTNRAAFCDRKRALPCRTFCALKATRTPIRNPPYMFMRVADNRIRACCKETVQKKLGRIAHAVGSYGQDRPGLADSLTEAGTTLRKLAATCAGNISTLLDSSLGQSFRCEAHFNSIRRVREGARALARRAVSVSELVTCLQMLGVELEKLVRTEPICLHVDCLDEDEAVECLQKCVRSLIEQAIKAHEVELVDARVAQSDMAAANGVHMIDIWRGVLLLPLTTATTCRTLQDIEPQLLARVADGNVSALIIDLQTREDPEPRLVNDLSELSSTLGRLDVFTFAVGPLFWQSEQERIFEKARMRTFRRVTTIQAAMSMALADNRMPSTIA